MSAVGPHFIREDWLCPWCGYVVPAGDVVWPVQTGTTETLACAACSWAYENGVPPRKDQK